jgi:CheY-like chemotaxis protein
MASTNTSPRLLVVDDEPPVLRVVKRFASELGFEVLCRNNGHEALASLAEVKPDAALVDLGHNASVIHGQP